MLSIEPSLLYLIGEPEDPAVVWEKLANQFQKRKWDKKMQLRRKLFSLGLKDTESVQGKISVTALI